MDGMMKPPERRLESFSIFDEKIKMETERIKMLEAHIETFQRQKKWSAGNPDLVTRIQGEINTLEKELAIVKRRVKIDKIDDAVTAEFLENSDPENIPQA